MKKGSKLLVVSIVCLLVMLFSLSSVMAAETSYSAIFEQETGIKDYGTVWIYESRNTQESPQVWKDAISQDYKKYWPVIPYDTAIFKGTHPEYPAIFSAMGHMHPYMDDAALTFIAPGDGKATIQENAIIRWFADLVANDAGDGVKVSILLNDKQIWPAKGTKVVDKTLEVPNELTVPAIKDISVKKGDKLRFVMQMGENNWCDPVKWEPIVSFAAGASDSGTTAAADTATTAPETTSNPKTSDNNSFYLLAILAMVSAVGIKLTWTRRLQKN